MKKLFSLLTAAVLILGAACTAQAGAADEKHYTVQDILKQAAAGWHQTYQAHGRTVAVDIPVQVPDTDVFPALIAEPMPALDSIPINRRTDRSLE